MKTHFGYTSGEKRYLGELRTRKIKGDVRVESLCVCVCVRVRTLCAWVIPWHVSKVLNIV